MASVAEKMTEAWIGDVCRGGSKRLEVLITTIADLGRKEAKKSSTHELACHPRLSMRVEDAIDANKWEEEET